MSNIQNSKTTGIVAALSFLIGIIALTLALLSDNESSGIANRSSLFQIAGLLLALAVILFLLMLQIKRRNKQKRNRYHAVHWDNGRITKDA